MLWFLSVKYFSAAGLHFVLNILCYFSNTASWQQLTYPIPWVRVNHKCNRVIALERCWVTVSKDVLGSLVCKLYSCHVLTDSKRRNMCLRLLLQWRPKLSFNLWAPVENAIREWGRVDNQVEVKLLSMGYRKTTLKSGHFSTHYRSLCAKHERILAHHKCFWPSRDLLTDWFPSSTTTRCTLSFLRYSFLLVFVLRDKVSFAIF